MVVVVVVVEEEEEEEEPFAEELIALDPTSGAVALAPGPSAASAAAITSDNWSPDGTLSVGTCTSDSYSHTRVSFRVEPWTMIGGSRGAVAARDTSRMATKA